MLKKRFLQEDNKVEVQFVLPVTLADEVDEVFLTGDFNNWSRRNVGAQPIRMTREEDTYSIALLLDMNREYSYLYVLYRNEPRLSEYWEMDWNADKYIPAPLGGCDSVVITYCF